MEIFRKYLSCFVIVLICTLLFSVFGVIATSIGLSENLLVYVVVIVFIAFFGWRIYTKYKANGE